MQLPIRLPARVAHHLTATNLFVAGALTMLLADLSAVAGIPHSLSLNVFYLSVLLVATSLLRYGLSFKKTRPSLSEHQLSREVARGLASMEDFLRQQNSR